MMPTPPKLERCKYGCCYFIDDSSVSKEEFEKANPVIGGKSIVESIVSCRMPCATCGHGESEHSAAGCRLSPEPKPLPGAAYTQQYLCTCTRFRPSPR